jgi:hypothetical protein
MKLGKGFAWRKLKRRPWPLSAFLLCVLFLATSVAQGTIFRTSRLSSYNITFADTAAFSDAMAQFDVFFTDHADAPTPPVATSFAVKTLFLGYSQLFTPPIVASAPVFNAPLSRFDFTLSATNAGDGTEQYHYATPIGPTFTDSWIVGGVTGGYQTMEFLGGGFFTAVATALFDVDVFLPGDWSQMGTTTGKVEFLGLDPGWTIVKNFQYDSINDVTEFYATNASFIGTGGPNLNFRLYGAAVPEPAAGVLAVAGLACLLAWRLSQGRPIRRLTS